MKKDIILFDLDGTLTDPMEGITKSVQYALKRFGIEVTDRNQLCCFIGPPLVDSFMEFYGFSREQARQGVFIYREYFQETGIYENVLYPGIVDLLKTLTDSGAKLMLATSKPEVFARQILQYFHIDSYFTFAGGANLEETLVKKGDIIRYVLQETDITDKSRVVMVGDRKHDILGAKENQISSVGVLYGYGDRKEHLFAGADETVETVEDLKYLLIKGLEAN